MAEAMFETDGIPGQKRGMGAIICMTDRKMLLRDNLAASEMRGVL